MSDAHAHKLLKHCRQMRGLGFLCTNHFKPNVLGMRSPLNFAHVLLTGVRRRKRRDEKKKGQVERYMTLRVRFYLWIVGPQGVGSQAASENNFNTISLAGISFLY
jgi:hypothetical protein